jgi:flavin-dependent dehydrogenase
MQPQNETIKYDVVIIGAGPAGCACALTLKDSGLKVAMLEKASFPRDKVCGDAIPGRAIKTLY